MTIEHVNDRNSTGTPSEASPMLDLQRAFVADHQADLVREGAALRAERARDRQRAQLASGTAATEPPARMTSRRVRVGRWLVGLGQAIAGPRLVGTGHDGEPLAALRTVDDPCGDGADLARAA